MKDVNIYSLDNGLEYYEIDNMIYNDVKYFLFLNTKDKSDICIKKLVIDSEKEMIVDLSSDETNKMFTLFAEKNKAYFE